MKQLLTPGLDRQKRTDSRGVSEVIGAILIFALIVMLLVLIQVNAVPAANKQVEFEHNQRVNQDFQSLQGELYQVGSSGDPASAAVETGIIYPNRFFLLNPGPATGSLRTSDPQSVTITNARAAGNPGDYWTGTDPVTYTTRGLVYTPDYNELQNPGTKYWEHSMLFTRYDNDRVIFEDPTSFIDGRQIRLTLLEGEFSETGLSTTVEISPISAGTRTVSLVDADDPITITLQTSLSESEWNDALDDSYASVTAFDPAAGTVTIELQEEVRYDLRVSTIAIGSGSTVNPEARYLTDIEGNGTSLAEDTSLRLVVEVRDQFNNPVSNVPVTAAVDGGLGTVLVIDDSRTDSDGRLTVRYDAPSNVDGAQQVRVVTTIDATSAWDDASQRVAFDLTVVDSDGSGNTNTTETVDINPYGPETVQLEDALIVEEDRGGNKDDVDVIDVRFTNTYVDSDRTISAARLVMYAPRNQQGGGHARSPPAAAILYDHDESVSTGYTLTRGGAYTPITAANPLETLTRDGGEGTFRFELVDDAGENFQPFQGEFMTLALEFDNGERLTYLVTPRLP